MSEEPNLTIPDVPLTVIARVYAKGDPLGGNICPPVRPCAHTCESCTPWAHAQNAEGFETAMTVLAQQAYGNLHR